MQPMQAAYILSNGATPGYRQCNKQRIQARVVKSLSDKLPGRNQHARLLLPG